MLGFLTKYPGLRCDVHRMTFVQTVRYEPWLCHHEKAGIFAKASVHGNNTKILFVVNTGKPTLKMKARITNCSLSYTRVVFETFCSTLLIKD